MEATGSSSFEMRTDVSNGVARLALVGELDMLNAPAVHEQVQRVVNDGADAALLDLRELTFMDAAGLRVLMVAKDRARHNGHRVAIVGVSGEPRRVLEITNTAAMLVDETEGTDLIRRFTEAQSVMSGESSTEAGERGDG